MLLINYNNFEFFEIKDLKNKYFLFGLIGSILFIILINHPLLNNILLFDINEKTIKLFKYDFFHIFLLAATYEKIIVAYFMTFLFFFFYIVKKSNLPLAILFFIKYSFIPTLLFYILLFQVNFGLEKFYLILYRNL